MRPPVALAGYDFTERLGLGGRLAGDLGPADPGQGEDQVERRAKLVRLTYDQETDTLGQPTELIAGIPAGTDHNAGRVKFGPDGVLYYPTGDQGGNGLANYCNPIRAQVLPTADQISAKDWSSYTGKILRLTPDGGIPSDKPTIEGVRSHIFSYGHRNPQGLVFGPDGALYSAEHGEKTDNEINLIRGRHELWLAARPGVSGRSGLRLWKPVGGRRLLRSHVRPL